MHVLMIANDPALTLAESDARQRHLEYARRAGKLTIVTYTPRSLAAQGYESPALRILPTNSASRYTFLWDALRLAAQAVRGQDVDLITTQEPFLTGLAGWWLRRKLRAPLLVQNHGYFIDNPAWIEENPLRNRVFNALAKFIIRRADSYRTCNQVERENYLKHGGTAERVFTFALGTASEKFATPIDKSALRERRQALGLLPEQRVVLWVGYPVKYKRVPLLLRVFQRVSAQLPAARLLLVGDMARSQDDLPQLVDQLGLTGRVILHGPAAHDDLPVYYQLADVYALTSVYEGLPRVLGEAAAAGLPLVGMACAGVSEVIRDGENGHLVADGDGEGMAQRIVELLADPGRAQAMGQRAREIALTEYSAAQNIESVLSSWTAAVQLGRRS